jgi:hypothetical protein
MTMLYKGYYPTAKVIVSVAANENWILYCLNSDPYLLLYFESISYTSHHLTPIQTMKTCLALHRQLFESHQLQLEMDEKKRKVKSVCTLFWFLFMIAPMLVQWGWISHAFGFRSTQYCMSGITRNGLAALDPSWNCSCAASGSYKLRCIVD